MRAFFGFVSLILSVATALAMPSAKDALAADVLAENRAATGAHPADAPLLQMDYSVSAYGMEGAAESLTDLRRGWSVSELKLGPLVQNSGYDGRVAWDQDASGVVVRQTAREAVALAVNQAYRDANLWWMPDFAGARISASEIRENGKSYAVLRVTPKGGKPFDAWFDETSHFLDRVIEKRGAIRSITRFDDYARYDGVMLARRTLQDTGQGAEYLVRTTLKSAKFLPAKPQKAFGPPEVRIADFVLMNGAAETTVPVRIVNNHIYGKAFFNGHPVTAIFDTGGANLVSPAVAKAAALPSEGALPVSGAGEGVMQASLSHAREIRIGDAVVKNQQIIVMPLDRLSPVEGMNMPAMVGFETFRRFVTRIDYAAGKLTLIDPKQFDPKTAGTAIPFIFDGHVPQVKGQIEDIPAVFDIDTGSRLELSVSSPFGAKHRLHETHPGVRALNGWGVGGASYGFVVRLKSVDLGPVRVRNVVADISTGTKGAFSSTGLDGNLGSGLLKRFIVTFDYGHQILYLKTQPLPVPDVGTYDRAGVWINLGQKGFDVVAVTGGGPAEAAGLLKGDVITAVDGRPADGIALSDLRRRLRTGAPGTVVRFTVLRQGRTQDFAVTLRDLI